MTVLKQKYAQVSDGCWLSPTVVQVCFYLGCRPGDCIIHFLDFVWKPHTLCCLYSTSLYVNFYAASERAWVQYSSAILSTKSTIWKRTRLGSHFWQMSFVLLVRSRFHFMCVSEKWASSLGLITLTHLVAFVVVWFQSQIATRPCWVCF